MKKLAISMLALISTLSFAAIASAVPATDQMNKSISVLENEDQGAPQASKPHTKPVHKPKKAQKKQRKAVKKEAAPASTGTPAASTSAPATPAAPASK